MAFELAQKAIGRLCGATNSNVVSVSCVHHLIFSAWDEILRLRLRFRKRQYFVSLFHHRGKERMNKLMFDHVFVFAV